MRTAAAHPVKREEYASPSDEGTVQVAAECAPQAPSTPRPGLSPPSEVADGLLSSSFFVTLPPLPFTVWPFQLAHGAKVR